MSHENSRTVEIDGKFYNVHGTTGEPLAPQYDFEKEAYDTLDEAVAAAKRRSEEYGKRKKKPTNPTSAPTRFRVERAPTFPSVSGIA